MPLTTAVVITALVAPIPCATIVAVLPLGTDGTKIINGPCADVKVPLTLTGPLQLGAVMVAVVVKCPEVALPSCAL